MRQVIAFCILAMMASSAICETPGVNFALKFDSFDALKNKILPGILSKVAGTKIGDKTVTYKKYLTLTYKNIVIDDFQLAAEDTLLEFPIENTGEFIVQNMTLSLKFDYEWSSVMNLKGTGSGTYSMGGASMAIALQAIKNGDFIQLMLSSANAQLGTVTAHMDGDGMIAKATNYLSDKLNFLLNPIATVELMLATFLIGQPALTKWSQQFPTKEAIGDTGVTFDYGFLYEDLAEDRFEFGLRAKFFETAKPYDPQPVGPAFYMPWYKADLSDAQFFISPSTINSALWSFWKVGGLKFTLTDDMIPEAFPLHLNTHDLDTVFPGIKTKFGDNKPCSVMAYPGDYPQVDIKDGKITLNYNGGILTSVVDGSNSVDAVDIAMELAFDVSLTSKDQKVYPKFESATMKNVKINKSAIDNLDAAAVAKNMETLTQAVSAAFNKYVFADGLSLPTIAGVGFKDPITSIPDEYALLSATPDFTEMSHNLADVITQIIEGHFHGSLDNVFGVKVNEDVDFTNLINH